MFKSEKEKYYSCGRTWPRAIWRWAAVAFCDRRASTLRSFVLVCWNIRNTIRCPLTRLKGRRTLSNQHCWTPIHLRPQPHQSSSIYSFPLVYIWKTSNEWILSQRKNRRCAELLLIERTDQLLMHRLAIVWDRFNFRYHYQNLLSIKRFRRQRQYHSHCGVCMIRIFFLSIHQKPRLVVNVCGWKV